MVLSRVDTASHAVLNVCRRVCVIAATTVFFGTPPLGPKAKAAKGSADAKAIEVGVVAKDRGV